jgi:hypothetical protein
MNGINSGLTASDILRSAAGVKTGDIKEQPVSEPQDTLVKAEQGDAKKLDFIKIDEKTKQAMIKGAIVGGASGAAIGGIAGYASAWYEIKTTVPENSITINWQEPKMQNERIGKIPRDYESSSSILSDWHVKQTRNIDHKNPEIKNDEVVLYEQSKTYTGHGELDVTWKEHDIENTKLKGWGYHKTRHTEKNDFGLMDDTKYKYSFYPEYDVQKVGEYKTPKVKFDNGGINVGLRTFAGAGIGLGVGAFAGAIAGAIIENAGQK